MAPLDPDTFAGALVARLTRLTPHERRVVLAQAIRLLAAALPRLSGPQRQAMAVQVAVALDAAGYPYEALLLRLAVLGRDGSEPNATAALHRDRRRGERRLNAQ